MFSLLFLDTKRKQFLNQYLHSYLRCKYFLHPCELAGKAWICWSSSGYNQLSHWWFWEFSIGVFAVSDLNHLFHSFFFSWFQVLDDKNVRRRFRASNYQSTTRVKPFICTMPMRLDDGWNQIQFNLSDFTRRAYGTNYIETLRVQVSVSQILKRHQLDTL